jgi:hypothetical protein
MPILKLQPNQTYRIGLKFKSATEKNGQWGKQFQYTLSDGHILYLPPVAHAEVQSLNVGLDEPFTIRKTIGPGNAAVWSVERIPGEVPAPKPVAAAQSIARTGAIPAPPSLTTRESIRVFQQLCAVIQAAKAAEEERGDEGDADEGGENSDDSDLVEAGDDVPPADQLVDRRKLECEHCEVLPSSWLGWRRWG